MKIKGPEVGGCLTCGNGAQGQDWVSRTAEGLGGSAQGLRGHGCGETAVVAKWCPTFCRPSAVRGSLGKNTGGDCPFSWGSSQPRDWTTSPALQAESSALATARLYSKATGIPIGVTAQAP